MSSELLELLASGRVDAFNATRDRRGTLDLFAADLAGISLRGVDFSGVNLQKADLSGTDLTGAVLARADLSGADLTAAILAGVVAIRSRWKEAYLGEADLSDADLTGADLSEADLSGARLTGAKLGGAKLRAAVMPRAILAGVDLAEAKLPGADLQEADLTGAVLREADLSRANLAKAKLCGADLTRARLANAGLREVDLSGAKLQNADLTAADLRSAVVTGADFTRADLTEAVLEGVAVQEAILTYAQVESGGARDVEPEAPVAIELDDPSIAISGSAIGVLWENEEAGGTRLRLAVGQLDQPFSGRIQELPLPTDAVLSRALVPATGGFKAVVLVERPGGLIATVAEISLVGEISPLKSFKLEYTPAVRPVVRGTPVGPLLFGISREGPGLQVHRVDAEGLTRLHRSAMATARGFSSSLHPVVLSKGGVLVLLGPEGPGQPMRAPASFPGRACGAAPLPAGLALAWTEQGQGGFHLAVVRPGEAPSDMRLLNKVPIGSLDLDVAGGKVWVAYTREDPRGRGPSTPWTVRLPDGDPMALVDDKGTDVDDLRFCAGGEVPHVAVSLLGGGMRVVALEPGGPRPRWRLG